MRCFLRSRLGTAHAIRGLNALSMLETWTSSRTSALFHSRASRTKTSFKAISAAASFLTCERPSQRGKQQVQNRDHEIFDYLASRMNTVTA
eukprot:1870887-Rhodomonas_salina.2